MAFKEQDYPILAGVDTVHTAAEIPQMPGMEGWKGILRMAQANNVFSPDTRLDLMTRPGMADVRATAINAAGIFTGLFHQGDLANNFFLAVSIAAGSHNLYQDTANPPGAITGGTNFTIGQDNLVSMMDFTDGSSRGTICMSRLRDTPQFLDTSASRSNFSITGTMLPKFGIVLGQRALYGAPSVSGTVQAQRVYWSDRRDGNLLTDVNTQFESFETGEGNDVDALSVFGELGIVGQRDHIFLLAVNPSALKPFAVRELPGGKFRGPVSHQGMVVGDGRLWWMGQKNIHAMDFSGKIEDVGDPIRPTIEALDDDRREFTVAGYDPVNSLVLFAVSNDGDTIHKRVIAINTKTSMIYPNWTLNVNAMGNRIVSEEHRLILGGYLGLFRNFPSGTTGDIDDAAGVIDADIVTPRHHVGLPHHRKLWGGIKVTFKPSGSSEAVTLQYRLNDASSWSDFAASPYTVTGTANDLRTDYFPLMKVGTHLQLRYRGEVMRIQGYTLVYKIMDALVH